MSQNRRRMGSLLVGLAPILLIAGLVLLHALVNWQWLMSNAGAGGADKAEHLTRSLRYYQTLSPLTLRGLFSTLVAHSVRPSLFHISASLAYWLLGFSVDAGPMINLLYMTVLLAATYGLGVTLADRGVGLLATALVGTYPMVFAMSRHFYLEFALMAMVTATMYALVASDGFQSRTKSILLGLCLGVGLLTKRTYVVFVLVPCVYVVLHSKLIPSLWRWLTSRPRIQWRALVLAIVGGALLAGLWFFPNRETIDGLVLGSWLFPIWWLLAALTLYLVALPSAPAINLLVSLSLGAGLASVWYVARIEFILRAADFAYGDRAPVGRSFGWLDPSTYGYYLRWIVVEHISPYYALFALLAGCILLYFWLRRRPKLATIWWVLICWVAGGYVLMTFTLYRQSRAILPILPAIALLTAAGLLMLPWRRLRSVLVALMLVGGFLQFAVLTFTPLHAVAEKTTWGEVGLFAQGVHIQWPDYGATDPGWWIHDGLLQHLESVRQAQGSELLRLGLLVNTSHINGPQFQPLLLTSYPNIVVESLTRASKRDQSAYQLLFDYDYIALKEQNRTVSDVEQELLDRLLNDPPFAFSQVFELDQTYPLPDGDDLYLYKRRDFDAVGLEPAYVADLAAYLAGIVRPGDALLVDTPAMLTPLARTLGDTPTFYQWPLTDDDLARIASQHRRILVVDWTSAQSDFSWLDRNAHRAESQWFGDLYWSIYGPAIDLEEQASGALFGQVFTLDRYALPDVSLSPGDVLPFRLSWRATQVPEERFKVFAHLLAADGRLVAQYDGEPVAGLQPTVEWRAGEAVDELRGILLPGDLPDGAYTLVVGWYPMAGGDRLPVVGVDGEPLGTQLELGTFQVVGHQP